ncbi:site-specific integrase [Knoellia locipacati]|uniref:Putative prophage phiRv2 integrase n=1 Tax=Knoellia locipacati TaxID=882824 RepID=A0A512T094_9MICO|nr:site-specific integrase [Knoellia locipacati]GEQ13560.1 putative prophage phiRv2 integrase [Knoellia locipacati]
MSPARRPFGAVRKRPSGRYSASYLAPDGLRRFAGRSFVSKADAHAWLAAQQTSLMQGSWTDPELARVTLSDYGGRWVKEHRVSSRTRDLYEGLFRLHIEPYLGRMQLDQIRPDSVRGWRAHLRDDGRSESTTAKSYRLLRAILNTAVDDGRIPRNPCRIRGADRERPAERPIATVDEVFTLADHVAPNYRVFVLTAALASLRWGELVGLHRRDLDLDAGLIHVRRAVSERGGRLETTLPKNDRTRTVAIPGVLVEELRSHLHVQVAYSLESAVFTGEKGGTPRRGNWRSVARWAQALDRAGLPAHFHFHDLRHTGNHLAAQTGASTRELMQRMGHSTVRAALIYQHATDARSRHLADRLDTLIRGQRSET